MPTGGFVGYAPGVRGSGNAGAASIFLTTLVPPRNGIATAVLQDFPGAVGSISFKALIYDAAHSVLLASGSTVTSVAANYNRFPLTANLNLTAGTTYYVGYVCANSLAVSIQSSGGPSSWQVTGGQSVPSPANPLVGGTLATASLMIALELDGAASQGFGWGPDSTTGVTLSTTNTLATLTATANQGARSILTHVAGSGKYYAEVDVGGTIHATNTAVGINSANVPMSNMSVNPGAYPSVLASNGTRTPSVSIGLSFVSGDTIGIAYDAAANLMWWNKNNGSWFGNSSTAGNPATGVGGFAVTGTQWPLTISAGTVTGAAATFMLRDTLGNLRYTLPAGFSPWSPEAFGGIAAQARAMVLA